MKVKVTSVVFCLLLLVAVSTASEHDDTLTDLEEERFERSHAAHCSLRGWQKHGTSCYILVNDEYTWFDAQAACHYMGAKLVEIGSAAENQFVVDLLAGSGGHAWIGLQDLAEEGTFVWTSTRQPPVQSFWHPGEPTNSGGEEDCVYIWRRQGKWLDQHCVKYPHPFVCEMPAA